MNLNIKSVFFMSQAAAKLFIAQGNGGKIINIASMLSFQGGMRVPSNTASKSGVMGVTRLMANAWAKHNINVNAIAPGYMATNNTQQLRADEQRSAEILDRIPIRVPSYTASKSGVMGVTRLMANEWAKHNINVNAIAPGYMATNNTQQLRADEQRSAEILDRIPAGRWGLPSDLMGPIVFLASSASDYVNGYTIAVDGGWLAR